MQTRRLRDWQLKGRLPRVETHAVAVRLGTRLPLTWMASDRTAPSPSHQSTAARFLRQVHVPQKSVGFNQWQMDRRSRAKLDTSPQNAKDKLTHLPLPGSCFPRPSALWSATPRTTPLPEPRNPNNHWRPRHRHGTFGRHLIKIHDVHATHCQFSTKRHMVSSQDFSPQPKSHGYYQKQDMRTVRRRMRGNFSGAQASKTTSGGSHYGHPTPPSPSISSSTTNKYNRVYNVKKKK